MEETHTQPNDVQFYHIKLDGILSSSIINWEGDLSIVVQPENNAVRVCLVIHNEMIRRFLNQFQTVNLSLDSAASSLSLVPQDNYLENHTHEDLPWSFDLCAINDDLAVPMEK